MNEAPTTPTLIQTLLGKMTPRVLAEVELLRTSPDFPREKLNPATCYMCLRDCCLYGQAFGQSDNPPALEFKRRHDLNTHDRSVGYSYLEDHALWASGPDSRALCAYIKGGMNKSPFHQSESSRSGV